jgi:hypothetical protein
VDALGLEDGGGLAGQRLDVGRAAHGGVDLGQLEGDQSGVVGVVLRPERSTDAAESIDGRAGSPQAGGDLAMRPIEPEAVAEPGGERTPPEAATAIGLAHVWVRKVFNRGLARLREELGEPPRRSRIGPRRRGVRLCSCW